VSREERIAKVRAAARAHNAGYAAALLDLQVFLREERARLDALPVDAGWVGQLAEVDALSNWVAARTATLGPTEPPPREEEFHEDVVVGQCRTHGPVTSYRAQWRLGEMRSVKRCLCGELLEKLP
jgi:hypothetical protein